MTPEILTDHDLLVRLDERVEILLAWSKDHDEDHASLKRGVVGALVAASLTGVGLVVDWFLRK